MKLEAQLMRTFSARILAGCGALLLGATMASAQLATQNDTMVTFSAPVSLPGVTLPAGSYLFKLADSQVNRNVVQVFAQDRSKIFATILAVPAERTEPADETVITFKEAPANSAPAVQYWYYPGDKRGQEFVYPKSQAVAIANAAHTSVLSVDSDAADTDAMKSAEISRVEPGANAAPSQTAQAAPATTPESSAPAAQPRAAETTTPAAPVTEQAAPAAPTAAAAPSTPPAAPSATASTRATSPEQPAQPSAVGTSGTAAALPKTASPIPLIGFAGLLALGSAFGVRAVRRVRA
jgi:hypothetical protein